MTSRTATAAALVMIALVGVYAYGQWDGKRKAGVEEAVAAIRAELADTTAKLDTLRFELQRANVAIAERVDTLVLRSRELVSLADTWQKETLRTGLALRAHLEELGDTIGVGILDTLHATHRQEVTTLRQALKIADDIQVEQLKVIGNLRLELGLADKQAAAARRAEASLREQIAILQSGPSLPLALKVGVPTALVLGAALLLLK